MQMEGDYLAGSDNRDVGRQNTGTEGEDDRGSDQCIPRNWCEDRQVARDNPRRAEDQLGNGWITGIQVGFFLEIDSEENDVREFNGRIVNINPI